MEVKLVTLELKRRLKNKSVCSLYQILPNTLLNTVEVFFCCCLFVLLRTKISVIYSKGYELPDGTNVKETTEGKQKLGENLGQYKHGRDHAVRAVSCTPVDTHLDDTEST